ncbi:MAG TPA: CHRD domain-containing protein, partial [Roseimicrobium sp.]|nr:CHRD domain-containing protein [Roseimicrobium sp.]
MSGFPLASDYDGDGYTNQAEGVAGTDPRNSLDCAEVTNTVISGTNVQVSIKTQTGKLYTLQSSVAPNGPTWTNEGTAITGNGAAQTVTVPSGTGSKHYRFSVSDKDTDGDGISDWAEGQMGTSPTLANSTNNASGGVASDGDVLRSMMSITTSVITSSAYEKENTNARVRLTRSFGTMPLTLSLTTSGNTVVTKGSASATDYSLKDGAGAALSASSFTIPSAATTFDVQVAPVVEAPNINEVPEMLRLTFRRVSSSVTVPVGATQGINIRDATNTTANRKLFVAYLGREGGASTTATGVATLLLNGDNTVGEVNSTFSNLTSAQSASHLHAAPATDPQASGPIVESLPLGQVTGHLYDVQAETVAAWTTDQAALNALFGGFIYINVHTANYASGEIRGNYLLTNGDPPTPTPPPVYGSPEWPALAGAELDRDIVRFLSQASFGPTPESIQEV